MSNGFSKTEISRSGTDWREAAVLGLIGASVFLLWGTWFVYPLRLIVVFFHEMGHAAAALLTGGRIVAIEVNAWGGGRCITAGGNPFWILSAGYLGSLAWGAALLLAASRTRRYEVFSAALGALLAFVTLWIVRPVSSFGFAFGLSAGLGLMAAGLRLGPRWNEFLVKAIGLTSCLYAVLDIFTDVLFRPSVRSDAAMLAELTGVPAVVLGVIWIGVAAPASVYFVLAACRRF